MRLKVPSVGRFVKEDSSKSTRLRLARGLRKLCAMRGPGRLSVPASERCCSKARGSTPSAACARASQPPTTRAATTMPMRAKRQGRGVGRWRKALSRASACPRRVARQRGRFRPEEVRRRLIGRERSTTPPLYLDYLAGRVGERFQAALGEQVRIFYADSPLSGKDQLRLDRQHHTCLKYRVGASLEGRPLVQFEADCVAHEGHLLSGRLLFGRPHEVVAIT